MSEGGRLLDRPGRLGLGQSQGWEALTGTRRRKEALGWKPEKLLGPCAVVSLARVPSPERAGSECEPNGSSSQSALRPPGGASTGWALLALAGVKRESRGRACAKNDNGKKMFKFK